MPHRKIGDDLKERAVVLVSVGWAVGEVAYALGVSERSVNRWTSKMARYGTLKPRTTLNGRPRILHGEALEYVLDLLNIFPSIYLDEITTLLSARFNISLSLPALHSTLSALGYTYKKLRKIPAQRDQVTRAQWKADIVARFTANQLVFVDESSKDDRTALRNYGRALGGQRACEVVSLGRGIRYSLLPALSVDGILTVRAVQGSVDGAEFYDWVVSDLISKLNPFPGPNSVVIMDNCRTHKSVAVREAIEAAGCLLIFLPPYSPDLNPIEEAFSCVKYNLRRHGFNMYQVPPEIALMETCMRAVTPGKARGWYAHSGYVVI